MQGVMEPTPSLNSPHMIHFNPDTGISETMQKEDKKGLINKSVNRDMIDIPP